jgi:hypothetical protein
VGYNPPAKWVTPPLRTTRSHLQFIIWDIQQNNFFKFNIHLKLQVGYPLAIANKAIAHHQTHMTKLTPRYPLSVAANGETSFITTGSLLQCIIRNILYNNFIKFNIHRKLQVWVPTPKWVWISCQQGLTPNTHP